ncbi:hypothetical protein DV735_g2858, partial [Chaetothyriales sp. CBS 134920]
MNPLVAPLALLLLLSRSVLAINEAVDPAKTFAMRTAVNSLTAYNSLSDSDYVYDWNSNDNRSAYPGSVFFADAATWPVLGAAGGTVSAAQINLEACAMLPPHAHRATKIAIAVNGTTRTWMRVANGATDRETTLTPGLMTVFPRGAIHTMHNLGCTPSRLYTFFDSVDPGTISVAQAFMATGPDIALAVMPFIQQVQRDDDAGNDNSSTWNATSNLVPPIALGAQIGTAECLKRECRSLGAIIV